MVTTRRGWLSWVMGVSAIVIALPILALGYASLADARSLSTRGLLAPVSPSTPFSLTRSEKRARPARLITVKPGWLSGAPASTRVGRLALRAAATPTTPFTECPAIGFDTSCGLLIDVTDSGVTVYQDPSQGPYDGSDDTLVGVINQSGKTLGHLFLASDADIFGFDGDGICSSFYFLEGCPFGPTGYEGPGTSFIEIAPDTTSGVVSFSQGIASGGSAYFALEEPLTERSVVSGGPSPSEQGGARNRSEHPTTCSAGQPVNCATGVFWHEFTDASVPGRGVPLTFTRTYSSMNDETDGPLGFGWTDSYNMSLSIDPETGAATIHEETGSAVVFPSNGEGGFTTPARVLATLLKNEDGTYTFSRYADHIHYVFSEAGQLLREIDRNGNVTTLAYSGGLLEKVTAPSGRNLSFSYSGTHVHTVTDPMGRTMTFSYDGSGNLTSAMDALGRTWTFVYDSNHLLLSMTNPSGGTTTNTYDSSARVTKQVDPSGRALSWSYEGNATSPEGGMTRLTDARGNVTLYHYANLELTTVTHGAGTPDEATAHYSYDPTTLGVTASTNADNETTRNTYDAHGNLLTSSDPLGRTTSYVYDALDDPISVTDPRGVTTSYQYDEAGNLIEKSAPLTETSEVARTTYAYEAAPGELTSVTDPDGHVTKYGYDSAGNRTSATDADGHMATCAYNANGQLTAKTTPGGHETTYTYDAVGQLTVEVDPLGHSATYVYDESGNRTSITDANGHITTQGYDVDDELTKITRPDGSTLETRWDEAGNMVAQIDAAGHATTYSYDVLNRLASVTDPDGHVTRYSYDPAGNKTESIDAEGQVTYYNHDAAGQLAFISYSDGRTPTVGEFYDADGNRTALEDGTGVSSYSYDSLGRMTSATDGSGATTAYSYDLAGHLTGLSYPNGKAVTRGYDAAGNLTSVTDWLGHTTRFSYDADTNLSEEQYANGVDSKLSYDSAGRVTSIAHSTGTATLASFGYSRDAVGQVTSETADNGEPATVGYARDSLDQLTAAGEEPYAYDAANNPTKVGADSSQSFDPANELTSSTRPGELTERSSEHEESGSGTTEPPSTPPHGPPVAPPPAGGLHLPPSGTGGGSTSGGGGSSGGVRGFRTTRPAVDALVHHTSKRGRTVTSPMLRARGSNDLILALISTATHSGTASVKRVSGGRLHWSLVGRSDSAGGASEVWQARASGPLNAPITVRLSRSASAVITIAAFTGTTPTVAAHTVTVGSGSAPVSPLAQTSGALLWAVGRSSGQSAAVRPHAGQRLIAELFNKQSHRDAWVQESTMPSGTAVIADAPAARHWGLVAVRIGSVGPAGRASRSRHATMSRTSSPTSSAGRPTPPSRSNRARSTDVASAVSSPTLTHQYTYNARGDRTEESIVGGPTVTLTYDQADRLTAVGSAISYRYNGDGLRTSKTVSGVITQFVWNQAEGLPDVLQDGTTYYIYGPEGQPVEQIAEEVPTYLQQDQHGSIRLLTDAGGGMVGRYDYSLWGSVMKHSGSATTNLQFDGEYTDAETGFQYLRARYYDPSTAQFVTTDPADSATRSRYGFGENDPVDLYDPTGMWFGSKLVNLVIKVGAVVPYAVYFGAYHVAKAVNDVGCSSWFGVAQPVTCAFSHGVVAVSPLPALEAIGLAGDVFYDRFVKHESICDEGVVAPINPLHSATWLPQWLRGGPSWYLPGVHANGYIDFET